MLMCSCSVNSDIKVRCNEQWELLSMLNQQSCDRLSGEAFRHQSSSPQKAHQMKTLSFFLDRFLFELERFIMWQDGYKVLLAVIQRWLLMVNPWALKAKPISHGRCDTLSMHSRDPAFFLSSILKRQKAYEVHSTPTTKTQSAPLTNILQSEQYGGTNQSNIKQQPFLKICFHNKLKSPGSSFQNSWKLLHLWW